MKFDILYRPSYSLAVLSLDPGEEVQAEGGAMVSMSPNISLKTEMKGGFLASLGRSVLGGESFFISRFVAQSGPGELTLGPSLPGDISAFNLQGHTFYVQSGSYLAAGPRITVDSKFAGARGFFSGEGLFLLRVSGTGLLLISSYGAIHAKTLAPGEKYVVDTSHIVAFESTINYQVRKAAAGWFSSIASGEGLVGEYTGPGTLYIQTRSQQAFLNWLIPKLPKRGD